VPHSKGFKGREERSGEAVPLGNIVEGLFDRKEFRSGGALGRLASRWGLIVGDRLAAETSPLRLESGVLVVAASTAAWAAQVRFLAEEIRRRADLELGSDVVKRVRVTVGHRAAKPL